MDHKEGSAANSVKCDLKEYKKSAAPCHIVKGVDQSSLGSEYSPVSWQLAMTPATT